MPAKIFHLITDLNTGGAEISLYRLLSRMDRTQFENQVVCLIPVGPVGEQIRAQGIPVRSLGMKPGQPTPGALFKLAGWLHQENPDILQSWLYHADLLALLAARLAGIQTVVWNIRNSGMNLPQYRRLSNVIRICAWLSRGPQTVISNSRAGQRFHTRHGYHPRRWTIIPNGIDAGTFKPDPKARLVLRQELGVNPETILIGQLARYHPMKNQTGFIQAAGKLSRDGIEAHFVMVGQDVTLENAVLADAVKREALEGRVHLLGRKDNIYAIEAALDILTSASSYGEGFPNVVAEAMACGVPGVVTDVGDSAYLVGETGLVVQPNDPDALANGWKKMIISGAEARRKLGVAARQRIEEHFSLDKTVFAYQALYTELVTRTAKKGMKRKAV